VSELELEQVLSKHLDRVKAPPKLTVERFSAKAGPIREAHWSSNLWARPWQPITAGVTAVAVAAIVFLWFHPPSSDLHSTDPTQIAAWLKARSFDVPLRPDPPASIRLTGAKVTGPTAQVRYLIAGRVVLLTVSPPSTPPPATAYHVVRSHLVRGQLYTLSCALPQDAHTACLLCHAGAEVN
jgi:hypothetical protein